MKIHSFTCLGFIVNRVIDDGSAPDLSYNELFAAAADGRLIQLLAERYGHIANFTFVTEAHFVSLEQMEAALCDAAAAYEGRVGKPTGPVSGLCLAMAIILEAIQQQFRLPPQPSFDLAPLEFN